tara:strand:+ start:29821 stop:30903 length:1083 start_codon:yes stop_codon:yes gene_type:complete
MTSTDQPQGENRVDGQTGDTLIETLTFGLTIPERAARSVSAIVGGLVNESAARLIPSAFRSSRSYTVFVQQALDMMVHDVGGVENPNVTVQQEQDSQLAQKAVGGLLDVAGAATLHLSPMTVLAVFSDLAYGSGVYLSKLSEELKREGIIDEDSSIDHVSDLIQALQTSSSKAADVFDTPPVSIEGIRDTIEQLSEEIGKADPRKLVPQTELARMWSEMEDAASKADVGLWDVSTTMTMYAMNRITLTSRGALSTINVATSLLDEHILGHYGDALNEIADNGLYATLSDAATPYLGAVWQNFESERETWTEELITGRMIGKAWQGVRGWFSAEAETSQSAQGLESPDDDSDDVSNHPAAT